ncbi:MAG: hypothetical protein ACR2OZ_00415 [Verrucomicrobiales bacterium]
MARSARFSRRPGVESLTVAGTARRPRKIKVPVGTSGDALANPLIVAEQGGAEAGAVPSEKIEGHLIEPGDSPSVAPHLFEKTARPRAVRPAGGPSRRNHGVHQDSPGFRWSTYALVFSATLAAGMVLQKWGQAPAHSATPPRPSVATQPPKTRRLDPNTFALIYRLRESGLMHEQLEKQFDEAQAFFRENQLDGLLDLDPWTLPADELYYLHHFCEKGYFTAEREILIKLLENRLGRRTFGSLARTPASSGVAARLQTAVSSREERIDDLRTAMDVYRRGRETEISVPQNLTPEQDQSLRAVVVQKIAEERRKRDALDARVAELQGAPLPH